MPDLGKRLAVTVLFLLQLSVRAFAPAHQAGHQPFIGRSVGHRRTGAPLGAQAALATPQFVDPSLASLTLSALQARCKAQGLPVSGKKADLADRLAASGKVPSPNQIAFENKLMAKERKEARISGKVALRRTFIEANQEMLKRSRKADRLRLRGPPPVPNADGTCPRNADGTSGWTRPKRPKDPLKRLDNLKLGQWLEGTVMRLTGFGAWVDVGSQLDGFLHVSSLAADRFVKHPADELRPGQEVKVCVKFVDPINHKLSLSCIPVAPGAGELIGGGMADGVQAYDTATGGVVIGAKADGGKAATLATPWSMPTRDELRDLAAFTATLKPPKGNGRGTAEATRGKTENRGLGQRGYKAVPVQDDDGAHDDTNGDDDAADERDAAAFSAAIASSSRRPLRSSRPAALGSWSRGGGLREGRPVGSYSEGDEVWGAVARVTLFGAYVECGCSVQAFLHVQDCPGRLAGQSARDLLVRGQRLVCYVAGVDEGLNRLKLTCFRPPEKPRVPL